MATKNRKCFCCTTTYAYCPDCSRIDALAPSWKAEFCSESCMTLWTTLTKFGMNRLTKSEAKSIISEIDLQPIDTYVACVQRDYAKVMTEDKKPKRGKRIEIKPMDDAIDVPKEIVESVVEELVEQQIVAEPVVEEPVYEVVEQENE